LGSWEIGGDVQKASMQEGIESKEGDGDEPFMVNRWAGGQ